MSTLHVASSLQDRKLHSTSVTPTHLSRDPKYGTIAALTFRVANHAGSRSESRQIRFNLDRADALKLREQLDAFLAIRDESPVQGSAAANAVALVLALHDNPTANPRGYLVKLDPMAEKQLRAAL